MATVATERLGVLGGTFDPVHNGHLAAAVNARAALELDRVLLVVANRPWQKTGRSLSPAEDRYAMVAAAVKGREGLEASRIEMDRGGVSYTADTLEQLLAEEPGRRLFLILGTDVAAQLDTWQRPSAVASLATVAIVGRGALSPSASQDVASERGDGAPTGFGSTDARWTVEHVDLPVLSLSSSDVRGRCRDGRPLDFLVPDPVIDLIRRRGLYAGAAMTASGGQ